MKNIFLLVFLSFISCKPSVDCMNEPTSLTVIVMNNKMDRKELLYSFKNATQKAMLYKIVDNKKILVDKYDVANCNV